MPGGCGGKNARAEHLGRQQTARGQGSVADQFGLQADAWPARQQPVFRVFGALLRRRAARLPVGLRRHDQAVQFLERPALFLKFDREPVQQFGVRRRVTLVAEVLRRADDPLPEEQPPTCRLTVTRAVSGFSGATSQRANDSRFAATPLGSGGRTDSTPGFTGSAV
jgi:hypothetical protein